MATLPPPPVINPLNLTQNQYGEERNQEATLYVGNIDERATESLLWELFIQAGPVVNVFLPKDRLTATHQGYGFVEYATEEDADYGLKVINNIKLFGKPLRINRASMNKGVPEVEVGAILFVGNLDAMVDEKMIYDTFSAFGVLTSTPKIARDPTTSQSKGYGFVAYDSFEASDAAIEAMNGQYLMNRAISVQYALRKDGKERHGSQAERLLASQARKHGANAKRGQKSFVDLAQAGGMIYAPLPAMPVAAPLALGKIEANLAPLPAGTPAPPGFQPPPPPGWKPT